MNAKAMLFVDDRKCEILKVDAVLKQGMGANQDLRLSAGDALEYALSVLTLVPTGEHRDTDVQIACKRLDKVKVLMGENLGRRHESRL